jgi:hypothetical protein
MDVNEVDATTVAVDIVNNDHANVSNPSPCLVTFFYFVQVTESPPGCLIQVGDGATL